jgi:gluconokinase
MAHTAPQPQGLKLLVMGVSGCGKSTLAARLAQVLGGEWIEGDEHHPAANIEKMRQGIALNDADRAPWLDALGQRLAQAPGITVLTCSALKKSYRNRLRAAVPNLHTVFIELSLEQATERLRARKGHFFHPRLVTSQFMTLELPMGEDGVLRVSALLNTEEQAHVVAQWLRTTRPAANAALISTNDLEYS